MTYLLKASWMSSRISQRMRKAAEPVQQCDRLFDHPPMSAQARAVHDAPAGDDRLDPCGPDHPAVLVMVIAPAGITTPPG
jgi:hypothetical protein